MAIEILRDSNVNDADQVALVDKYTKLRQSCDVKGIMEIVTDDIQLESALASPKGRAEFEAYLKKQKPGEGSPAKMVDGICQMNGKAKIAFIPVSFVGKFGITDTEEGPKIEKIVVSRS